MPTYFEGKSECRRCGKIIEWVHYEMAIFVERFDTCLQKKNIGYTPNHKGRATQESE